jgi:hypothetical protein
MSVIQAEAALDATSQRGSEIRIFGHSTIFYWWPVWMAGFVMAAITFAEGSRAAIVPSGAVYDDASHLPESNPLRNNTLFRDLSNCLPRNRLLSSSPFASQNR